MTACSELMQRIGPAAKRSNSPLYVVFVNYRAVFDLASRSEIIRKLAEVGVSGKLLRHLLNLLHEGSVALEDGVSQFPPIRQTESRTKGRIHECARTCKRARITMRASDRNGATPETRPGREPRVYYPEGRGEIRQLLVSDTSLRSVQ